ncbi:hypothetical protein [Roseisolibacter sp. H3M3-2]|uniref:hypothetical protein n=1 Tax=Roseisolibacter sp. H3M3-2 TaxID=3031323 RepID=UPI0023DB01DD|nr:hypothetical protein [Roseisolibacter sp. H3M3-2]MDF1502021.1 hypothetical protein [Roseisolibacter sp. H3M3-2]
MTAPPPPAAPYGPQTLAIRRFLQRLAALPAAAWDEAAARHEAAQGSPRFAAAARVLAAAVAATQREPERDAALGPLLQLVAVPTDDPAPDAAPELAPVAEAALAAVLALLVRDVLSATAFATLYAPFAEAIPPASLDGG